MPVVAALPAIGGLIGAGTSIANAVGGSPTGSNGSYGTTGGSAAAYQPTGQANADSNYQSLFNNSQNYAAALPGQVSPVALNNTSTAINNPYSGSSIDWATALSQMGQGVSQGQLGAASNLYGLGTQAQSQGQSILNSAQGYGNQIMASAFDPQSTLYNQQYQQNQDQTNVVNSMNGVAGTPYGAGLSAQSSQNFNTSWENQQLARQTQGASAYTGLVNSGVNNYNTLGSLANTSYQGASTLGNSALNSSYATGNLPYSTYQGQTNDIYSALNSLNGVTAGAQAPSTSLMSALQSYLNGGQSANTNAQSGALNSAGLSATNGANLAAGLGSAPSNLSSLAQLLGLSSGGSAASAATTLV